jgi:hypothetical protein
MPQALRYALALVFGAALTLPLPRFAALAADTTGILPCIGHEAPPEPDPVPEAPTTGPVSAPAAQIRFNELLPDPAGTDADAEFIELRNDGASDEGMSGWRIVDGKAREFVIGDITLPAGAHYAFVYAETKIPLVNSGGLLELRDPEGAVRDRLAYPAAVEGMGYSRNAVGEWRWTSTPTPGYQNVHDAEILAPTAPEAPTAPVPDDIEGRDGEASADEPAESAAPADAIDVRIDAFLPDPVGSDDAEWVRLKNAGASDAMLDGWTLDDAEGGSAPFRLDGIIVSAGTTVDLPRSRTKLALNNDGDEVRLIGPDGTVADAAAFGDAPEGAVMVRGEEGWQWSTEVSPEGDPPEDHDVVPQPGGETAAEEEGPVEEPIDVADAVDAADGEEVRATGVVTVPPGVFGKTLFGIGSEDADAAMIVRVYGRGPLPPLEIGNLVIVAGTVRRGTEARISTTATAIEVSGNGAVRRTERATADIHDDMSALPVAVRGIVVGKGPRSFRIADAMGEEEVRVTLAPGIVIEIPDQGAEVTVRGVVRRTSSGTSIALLSSDAIERHGTAPPAEAPIAQRSPEVAPPAREPLVLADGGVPANPWSGAAATAVALAAVAGAALYRRHRRLAAETAASPY